MNKLEYKKAYEKIVPSKALIHTTLCQIEKQKRNKKIMISTYLQVAIAACFCVVIGISTSNFTGLAGNGNNFAGSMFGKDSGWMFAVLLFAIITAVIVILNKRRK